MKSMVITVMMKVDDNDDGGRNGDWQTAIKLFVEEVSVRTYCVCTNR